MTFKLFMHHIDFCSILFCADLQSALGFSFFLFSFCSSLCLCPYPSTMPRKTRVNRTPSLSSVSPSRSELFMNDKSREVFEKLNCKRKIWAEHSVVLDDVDPAIRENFESKGWLSLLEVDHPPLTALIRDFFSNLSCHVYDSNTLVRSWIRNVASMNFPYLFFRSLNEVHRSSAIAHRILLFLSLVDFPVGEPVH